MALLRYFSNFNLDTNKMTIDEICEAWQQLKYGLIVEGKYTEEEDYDKQ